MPDADETRTRELVEAAQAGEAGAQESLLRAHLDDLRAFVRLRSDVRLRLRESESDLVQSICREVLTDLSGFEYRDAPSFRSWLFTLALNKVREKGRFHGAERRAAHHEERSLDAPAPEHVAREPAGAEFTPSQHAAGREAEERFEAAFDRLSEGHREVILLSRVLRLPHAEIARRMDRSEVAVRSLLSRALVTLSGELGGIDGEG